MIQEQIGSIPASDIEFVPLQVWPGAMTDPRRGSPFTKATTQSTFRLLKHELRQIRATNPRLQLAVQEHALRRDGLPRSDARPAHPGVILSFDAGDRRLVYPCDTFVTWQANLRAIALTLEALRKPSRYGVLNAGEQYAGNRLLTAGGATTMSTQRAAEYIAGLTAGAFDVSALLRDHLAVDEAYRRAAAHAHPDAGGSPDLMDWLTKARDTLRAHHGLGRR